MQTIIHSADAHNPTPIQIIAKTAFDEFLQQQDATTQNWLVKTEFKALAGSVATIPDNNGNIAKVLFVIGKESDPGFYARLTSALPAGDYRIASDLSPLDAHHLALGWALHCYRFAKFKTKTKPESLPRLVCPDNVDFDFLQNQTAAIFLTRDLINRPANDLTPKTLADAAIEVVNRHGATCNIIIGEDLKTENYPMLYDVGKASGTPPRLIDIVWGDENAPKITLVGKGVTFDSGGLDIKDAGNMLIMKKDMGGAATALGLAQLIMAQKLNVRLRVLIAAVENSISGNAMRPLDVLQTRKGITVEVGNTDAEGRLVLADCLFEAAKDDPQLLIDFATLTGAARVALGFDLPAIFCQHDDLAAELLAASRAVLDPVWPLPLWQGYRKDLESRTADISSTGAGGMGGAIIAALFLQEFVNEDTRWIHIDTYGWNKSSRPGRPEGGEALALRACYELIRRQVQ